MCISIVCHAVVWHHRVGGSGDSSQDTHHQPLDVSGTCVALAVGAAAASLQAWWLGLPIQ